MEDLSYIVGIGFSGADLPRAVILSFFLAVLFAARRSIWLLGLVALVIDRIIWPIVAQASAGAEIHTIYATIGAMVQSAPQDLGVYVVRYVGLTVMIGLFAAMRMRLHKMGPAPKAA